MNTNYDNKKIIQMVAIIGILCLFVGIATRIRQSRQVTLADLKKSQQAESVTEVIQNDDEKTESSTNVKSPSKENTSSNSIDPSSDSISQFEYKNFYYIDGADNICKLHILYYNSKHELSSAELSCSADVADEKLKLFYDLYKSEHIFESIDDLTNLLD